MALEGEEAGISRWLFCKEGEDELRFIRCRVRKLSSNSFVYNPTQSKCIIIKIINIYRKNAQTAWNPIEKSVLYVSCKEHDIERFILPVYKVLSSSLNFNVLKVDQIQNHIHESSDHPNYSQVLINIKENKKWLSLSEAGSKMFLIIEHGWPLFDFSSISVVISDDGFRFFTSKHIFCIKFGLLLMLFSTN